MSESDDEKPDISDAPKKNAEMVSFIENDYFVYEIIQRDEGTWFLCWNKERQTTSIMPFIEEGGVVPMMDDGVTEGAVKLPTGAKEYGTIIDLLREIQEHIHRFVDVSPEFERICVYYILLSWVYDKLRTLPYLRFMGDTGSGKTRAEDVIGGLCYRPCKVAGAVTPAPIYRLIRAWRGTIILDEADMEKSDEKNEVVKILNCGFQRDVPVIRCYKDDPDNIQYLPTFGPKILASRFSFHDKALEARCLTHVMEQTDRDDIPIELGAEFREREDDLRDKLLMFRLRNRDSINPEGDFEEIRDLEPRIRQMVGPFIVLAGVDGLRAEIVAFARQMSARIIDERSTTTEGEIVSALVELGFGVDSKLTPTNITDKVNEAFPEKKKLDPRVIGRYLKSLNIRVKKTKLGGKAVNLILFDAKLWRKLTKRYIPSGSEGSDSSIAKADSQKTEQVPSNADPLRNGTDGTNGTIYNFSEIALRLRVRDAYIPDGTPDDDVVRAALTNGAIMEITPGRYRFV